MLEILKPIDEYPASRFPSIKPEQPNIFQKRTKGLISFCINDIYITLFTESKSESALVSFSTPHSKKSKKSLVKFLLPNQIIDELDARINNEKKYITDKDYQEFLLKSTKSNKISKELFNIFSTNERKSEFRFINTIQTHFIDMLKNANFKQPELNDLLRELINDVIAPAAVCNEAYMAFNSLIESGKHDDVSKAIANIFICAMLGLYSIKFGDRNEKYRRVYLLNDIGMKYVWTPHLMQGNYVKLQDALYSYTNGAYESGYTEAAAWLAAHGKNSSKNDQATALRLLGACLVRHSEKCKDIIQANREMLNELLTIELPNISKNVTTEAFNEECYNSGITLLKKAVKLDSCQSEAQFLLYEEYKEKTPLKAYTYLRHAFKCTYVKAVFEVAELSINQQPVNEIIKDDIIEKLSDIISSRQYRSNVEVRKALYLRSKLDPSNAENDLSKAASMGHEKARQEMSSEERNRFRVMPTFIYEKNAPCCFTNSLSKYARNFISTLPKDKWNLYATVKTDSLSNVQYISEAKQLIDIKFPEKQISYGSRIIFLFMSSDENRNLNECLELLDELFNTALDLPEEQKNNLIDSIDIFVGSRFEVASALIDASISDMGNIYFKVHILDEARDSAHKLLCDAPLFLPLITEPRHEKDINAVLFGSSETNYHILKESIACAYLGKDTKVNITLIGSEAEHLEKRLRQECPGLYNECNIETIGHYFIKCNIDEENFPSIIYGKKESDTDDKLFQALSKANYFVVDLDDDMRSIRFAMELRTWLLRSDMTFERAPFIGVKCKEPRNSYLAAHLTLSGQRAGNTYYSSYDLFAFGSGDLYTYHRLAEEPLLEHVALQMHKCYSQSDDRKAENDYYSFSYYSDSCLLAAIGLCYRMFAAGVHFARKEEYIDFHAYNSAELLVETNDAIHNKLNQLAELEHHRWVGFELTRGWEPADFEQVIAYKEQSTGSAHVHKLAKLHPFIRPYADLGSEDIKKIMKLLKTKYDYSKHPQNTTKQNILDTEKFLDIPANKISR
ncbi:hypothetical protein [Ruminococcus albus]|uniref:Uncharacterized protein n=1 Tax=Ruminococcus albus TaxID=1264 RepID=A0A1H7PK16_RUMAL|nr:hypothetical protein [Ruminococcus albus]SEL35818.1 hypothetical protein SAMN05216469_12217 [Ruminococcus albus]